MFWIELFKRSVIMLFEKVYLVSLLFVSSAGKFYKVGCFVYVIGIAFNDAIGGVVKRFKKPS